MHPRLKDRTSLCRDFNDFHGLEVSWKLFATDRPTAWKPQPADFSCMLVHSSFLIRCALSPTAETRAGKPFYIQHIQTGVEFRSATLAEISQWIAEQNLRYLNGAIGNSATAPEEEIS